MEIHRKFFDSLLGFEHFSRQSEAQISTEKTLTAVTINFHGSQFHVSKAINDFNCYLEQEKIRLKQSKKSKKSKDFAKTTNAEGWGVTRRSTRTHNNQSVDELEKMKELSQLKNSSTPVSMIDSKQIREMEERERAEKVFVFKHRMELERSSKLNQNEQFLQQNLQQSSKKTVKFDDIGQQSNSTTLSTNNHFQRSTSSILSKNNHFQTHDFACNEDDYSNYHEEEVIDDSFVIEGERNESLIHSISSLPGQKAALLQSIEISSKKRKAEASKSFFRKR